MVKIEFGKGDFVWIGLVIVLMSVGYAYGYNSGASPSVMGHSSDEIEFGRIVASGADSTYGALTVDGSSAGWGGVNFKDGAANLGTLMVHKNYQGFYNDADDGWDWYFKNGEMKAGTVPYARITGAPAAGGTITCNWVGWREGGDTNCNGVSCDTNPGFRTYCSGGVVTSMQTATYKTVERFW